MRPTLFLLILLSTSLFSCKGKDDNKNGDDFNLSNDYAALFSIAELDNGLYRVSVNEKWSGKPNSKEYLLIPQGAEPPKDLKSECQIIPIPLKRVVCMSTSHVAYLSKLNQESSIIALSGARYINNQSLLAKVESGVVVDIGFEGSINFEMLMKLSPDLIFTYGISGENNQYIEKMRSAGFNVVVVGDYMEEHPLGKVEYLKFFGLFFDLKAEADSIYNQVKNRYIELQNSVQKTKERPVILLNAPWKDVWYIPSDNSYMTHLIKDAGGEVLLSGKGEAHTHSYSLEYVIKESYRADFWLNTNFFSSLQELKESNPLFAGLPLLAPGKVFNNTKRYTPGGGSDFWERGVVEPDVILEDLITIFHSTGDKKKELVYYKPLL